MAHFIEFHKSSENISHRIFFPLKGKGGEKGLEGVIKKKGGCPLSPSFTRPVEKALGIIWDIRVHAEHRPVDAGCVSVSPLEVEHFLGVHIDIEVVFFFFFGFVFTVCGIYASPLPAYSC
jgi:hypothetical protein